MLYISPEQLIASNIKLISLPAIVDQINQLVNDPSASAADIADAVDQDATLAARLLQIVNSPFYCFPSRNDTLSMAVTVLGNQPLLDLVIAAAIIKRFKIDIDPAFNTEIFWCHSITTAIVARRLALKLRLPNPEHFFVTGVLHDIGKIVLYLTMPNESITLLEKLQKPDCDIDNIERRLFGFTHDDVAVALLSAWHFPESIIAPIRGHVLLEEAEPLLKHAALLHLANNIANNMQAPVSRDDDTVLNPRAIELLQLTPDSVEAIYEETYRHLDELLEIFYYDVAG